MFLFECLGDAFAGVLDQGPFLPLERGLIPSSQNQRAIGALAIPQWNRQQVARGGRDQLEARADPAFLFLGRVRGERPQGARQGAKNRMDFPRRQPFRPVCGQGAALSVKDGRQGCVHVEIVQSGGEHPLQLSLFGGEGGFDGGRRHQGLLGLGVSIVHAQRCKVGNLSSAAMRIQLM